MENREDFSYTYSAQHRQEVENIRKNYLPKEEDKLAQLRKLHNSASQKAQAWAIAIGVIGTLILGTGMSLTMTDLGASLGLPAVLAMALGVGAGLLGLILVALAYPVYDKILKKERARIAPEILRLSEELLN